MRGWFILFTLLAAGCGGGPSFDGRVLDKELTSYRVGKLGPEWKRVKVEGNDLAFHAEGKGTLSVHASCKNYDDVPQTALMNHLLFGTSQRAYRVEEDVVLDGRQARHAVVDARLDGVPIRVEVFLLINNGCVYDLSLISARDRSGGRAEFLAFVDAFRVLRAGRE